MVDLQRQNVSSYNTSIAHQEVIAMDESTKRITVSRVILACLMHTMYLIVFCRDIGEIL